MLDDDTLNLVISSIYDAGLDDEHWPVVLGRLTGIFGAAFGASLVRSSDFREAEGRAVGMDPAEYQRFLRDHFRVSPFHQRMPAWQPGAVIRAADHMPFNVLERSAMYQEFWRPHRLHDGLRLNIAALPGGHVHNVNLIRRRGEPDFGAEEIRLARFLMPHLQRASAIRRRMGALSMRARDAQATLDTVPHAMLMLRGDGMLLHANRRAEDLLRSGMGLVTKAGVVGAASALNEERLRAAIARTASSGLAGALRLPRPTASALVALTVPLGAARDFWLPDGAEVLLCVTDPDDVPGVGERELVNLFGLTRSEARLALHLLAGEDLIAIAARTGRSRTTLRSHLARLMAKTGTDRQGALIRALAMIPGLR